MSIATEIELLLQDHSNRLRAMLAELDEALYQAAEQATKKQRIIALHKAYPTLTQQVIAQRVDTYANYVSTVLREHRNETRP